MSYKKDELSRIENYFTSNEPDPITSWRPGGIDGMFLLEDIVCQDSEGKIFESYRKLWVPCDRIENETFRTAGSLVEGEKELMGSGYFLPSFALVCNVATKLFEIGWEEISDNRTDRRDERAAKALTYIMTGSTNLTNTIIDYKEQKVIHYPSHTDVNPHSPEEAYNIMNKTVQRTELNLPGQTTTPSSFKVASCNVNCREGLMNLTGLDNPEKLVKLGKFNATSFNFESPIAEDWKDIQDGKRGASFGYSFKLNERFNDGGKALEFFKIHRGDDW